MQSATAYSDVLLD